MRKFIAVLLTTVTVMTALPVGAETVRSHSQPDLHKVYPNESYAQYSHRRVYHPRPHHRYYTRRHYYRNNDGAAVAAGVAGLAAGAPIAGAIASQAQAQPAAPPPPGTVDPSVAAYCARKYRSYDPVTGTFLAKNGMRYVCTYP